jgi:hypothetical protein
MTATSSRQATTDAPSPATTCALSSERCMAPGSENIAFSSAFSAAISRAAAGEGNVLRRMSTVGEGLGSIQGALDGR